MIRGMMSSSVGEAAPRRLFSGPDDADMVASQKSVIDLAAGILDRESWETIVEWLESKNEKGVEGQRCMERKAKSPRHMDIVMPEMETGGPTNMVVSSF